MIRRDDKNKTVHATNNRVEILAQVGPYLIVVRDSTPGPAYGYQHAVDIIVRQCGHESTLRRAFDLLESEREAHPKRLAKLETSTREWSVQAYDAAVSRLAAQANGLTMRLLEACA
jgi:hypothetical protein